MKFLSIPFVLLAISIILIFFLTIYIAKKKPLKQLHYCMLANCICSFILSFGVLIQDIFSSQFGINPIYFENIIYIGTCFLPVSLFFTSLVLLNTKITFKKRYLLLFIVPILSLIIIWTNNIHHLFYKEYSLNLNDMKYGSYFYVHTIYSYGLTFMSIALLIYASIKSSGFFSKQSALMLLGTLIPTCINLLGYLGIINITVYATPISFNIALFFYAIAIFRFKFLSISPIALQRIVDRISDSYIVLNEDFIITDFNKTFLDTFKFDDSNIRNVSIYNLINNSNNSGLQLDCLTEDLKNIKTSEKTVQRNAEIPYINKYFNIEISSIFNKNNFIGIVILFKDITQHIKDLNTIKDNQDTLMEKERLASLGQLIGGISHNLKTPIMSISGASQGLTDLIDEYDKSVGDPEVTNEDHHAIANDMRDWISKIQQYTAYMSDIITAVKGQAVALSENQSETFTVSELLKRVNILMKHEIQNANLTLNVKVNVPEDTSLVGDINSLVQVINNLITNAIQAYNGKKFDVIDLIVSKENDYLIISVSDNGCGMTDEVKEKLFKSMITTKGKNGTGLGMFMSYSTVKGHFNGDITFTSEVGKGTTFNVILPLQN